MQDPKFENNIREQMDELKFVPSGSLWINLEKELDKDKRRRVPLFWFFLLPGLLLGGISYFAIRKDTSPGMETVQQKTEEMRISGSNRKPGAANQEILQQREETAFRSAPKNKEFIITPDSRSVFSGREPIAKKLPASNSGKLPVKEALDDLSRPDEKNKGSVAAAVVSDTTEKIFQQTTESASVPVKQNDMPAIGQKNKNDSLKTVRTNPVKEKNKNRGWLLGFSLSPGISSIHKSLLQSTVTTDPNNSAVQNLTAAPYAASPAPSTIRSGFGFSAGVFLKRAVLKKLSFSLGLNYDYYSTSISIGYNGSYKNHYQFLDLPVSLEYQVNKSLKPSILISGAVSVSRLLAADALQYSGYSRAYYKDNSLFNKTQLAGSFALLFGFSRHKNNFQIGPELQYGFTDMLKNNAGNKEHRLFGGLKMTLTRNRK